MTQRSDLHAEYEAARLAHDEAGKVYQRVSAELWTAEAAWDEARDRLQRAFVALSREPVVAGELSKANGE